MYNSGVELVIIHKYESDNTNYFKISESLSTLIIIYNINILQLLITHIINELDNVSFAWAIDSQIYINIKDDKEVGKKL